MKIESSQLKLASSHFSAQRLEISERLEAWTGDRSGTNRSNPGNTGNAGRPVFLPAAAPAPQVQLSDRGLAANELDVAANEEAQGEIDPSLRMLKSMIEFLTGREIRLFRAESLQGGQVSAPADPGQAASQSARPSAGFGVAYDFQARYEEVEAVAFQAEGVVRTSDGREIRFELQFQMQRSYQEELGVSVRMGDARQLKDPLVLDFAGTAAQLSDQRFAFDLTGDGQLEDLPTLQGGRGFLAFDRDSNGRIDNGRELFGPQSGDGFRELEALDSDGNGWIDENDAAFDQLYVWRPAANGQDTMQTLKEAGIGALYLGRVATPFDVRNANNETLGVMRASSIYLQEDGRVGSISQIDLAV